MPIISMPILRKILNVGDSQAVTIPKSWLRSAEDVEGKKVIAIAMEVDGSITLSPVFEKEQKTKPIPAV
jgi:antitoxin component of MazEF toxin-antitoxin module